MGFQAKATIDGLEPLLKRLDALKKGKRTAILKRATTKGTKIVLDAAKTNLRGFGFVRKDSLLLQSLGSKIGGRRGNVFGVVGPRTGFKRTRVGTAVTKLGAKYQTQGVNPVRYAHLVEKGRKEVKPVKAKALLMIDATGATVFSRRARAVQARPFLNPALEANVGRVRDVMAAEIVAGLVKLAKAG